MNLRIQWLERLSTTPSAKVRTPRFGTWSVPSSSAEIPSCSHAEPIGSTRTSANKKNASDDKAPDAPFGTQPKLTPIIDK
jgi:hypothetical protein